MEEGEFASFKDVCFKEIENKQARLIIKYNLGKYDEYWCDQSTGIIQFKKHGKVKLQFAYIPIGVWLNNTWTWAWVNESITEELRLQSIKLKELAEVADMDLFKIERFEVLDEDLIHDLTAMAVHHLNAIGLHVLPDNEGESKLFLALMKKV